ncbi:MAG: hypothetical protein Kow00127_22000 [Bacteroidales bacterium]
MPKNQTVRFAARQLLDIFLVAVIGLAVSLLFAGSIDDFPRWVQNRIGYVLLIGVTLWKGNEFIGWLITRKEKDKADNASRISLLLISMFLFSVADILLVNWMWGHINFGLSLSEVLVRSRITMVIELFVTMIIASAFVGSGYFRAWRESRFRALELEKEQIRLRYNVLRNQVNPHFLFNSLNTLSGLVETDPSQAGRFIRQLSDVYRYLLDHQESDWIVLDEELEFCRKYLYLLKIRHQDNLTFEIRVEDSGHFGVVPLSVQLLLENAVKHNEVSSVKPLNIIVARKDDWLEVTNNLQPRRTLPEKGGTGLKTLQNRYRYFTDREVEILSDGGRFTVRLPLLKLEEV